jgi:hypothetical protein
MRIRYTEFALNPALRGTISHLPAHRAQALIDSGAAVELPYKNYVERLNDEQAQRAADPKNAPATGWSVRESVGNNPRVRFVVVETSPLGEITFYDAPPLHAPASVKQKYADAVATDAAAFSSRAEFLAKQRNEPRITTGHTATDLAVVTFGANGVVKRG